MPNVDPVIAGAVAHLTATARKRLDRYVKLAKVDQKAASTGYTASKGEMPELPGVQSLDARMRRGDAVLTLRFEGGISWEAQALTISRQLPDTLVASMRGRSLDGIVAHPLLSNAKVSSARINKDDVTIIETKRRGIVALEDVASIGVSRPLDIEETLVALGISRVCKVGANLASMLDASAMQTMLERLCDQGQARLTDLLPWLPAAVESANLSIKEGVLLCQANLTNGIFRTGWMSIHGGSRSRARALGGSVFISYKRMGRAYETRKPKEPTIALDEFVAMTNRKDFRRIAA